MNDLAEILLAKPEQRCSVEFRIAADVVIRVRAQRFAVRVLPRFLRVVLGFQHDGLRAPVVFLTRKIVAALDNEDLLAGRSQPICESAAARSAAYDDYVVVSVHTSPMAAGLACGFARRPCKELWLKAGYIAP